MPRVYNKRCDEIPQDAVYCGRPSKWGNPFVIGKDGSRQDVINKYRLYLLNNDALMASLGELTGKDLVCWCSPQPCHCDVLLRLANGRVQRHRTNRPMGKGRR